MAIYKTFSVLLLLGLFGVNVSTSKSVQNCTLDDNKYVTKDMFESMKSNMTDLITELVKRQTKSDERIFFYVFTSGSLTYNTYSIVKFGGVYYNEGNYFNTGDSVFVAPYTGVYLFSWTTQTNSGDVVHSELRVANVMKGQLYMNLGSSVGTTSATRVIIVPVNKNDHVWIQTSNSHISNYFNNIHSSYNSFIGVLLFQT